MFGACSSTSFEFAFFNSIRLIMLSPFSGKGLGSFDDIHLLTMFADYRVPQLLRDTGVMVYSDQLAAIIDAGIELLAGSEEETQIRHLRWLLPPHLRL
jgi:hypothetical protein